MTAESEIVIIMEQETNISGAFFPDRITFNPNVMGGKPCVRGMRVTVGMIVGLMASGYSTSEIIRLYPYLEEEDIRQSLAYAAWRVEEMEIPLTEIEAVAK